jgi:hypothetical protein
MSTQPRFSPGAQLIVKPCDGDDPEATKHAGQRCQFVRYAQAPGNLADYAVVKFSEKGRQVFLRQEDLARCEEATS